MPKLKELIFSITNRCNLRCIMCDIPQTVLEELTTGQLKKVITDASSLGFSTIVFSGGEPLLREDIFDLISYVKYNRMNVCIASNGCLIDEDSAYKLSRSGADVVNISIDGPEQVHDYLRGKGTFGKAVSALDYLRKYSIETTIAAIVCRHNCRYLTYIVELARQYRINTIRFQPYSNIFVNNAGSKDNFLAEKENLSDINDVFHKIIKLTREYNIAVNPQRYLEKIPAYLIGQKIAPSNGCYALKTTCSINARGDVFPCWMFTDADSLIGNVRKESLYELWNSQKHKHITESIIRGGCPGCMMSCYDEVFGQDTLAEGLLRKARKIKSLKAYKRFLGRLITGIRRELSQVKSKYRFYKSYRGSLKKVLNRIFGKIQRTITARDSGNKDDIEMALKQIKAAKERLKEEIA